MVFVGRMLVIKLASIQPSSSSTCISSLLLTDTRSTKEAHALHAKQASSRTPFLLVGLMLCSLNPVTKRIGLQRQFTQFRAALVYQVDLRNAALRIQW